MSETEPDCSCRSSQPRLRTLWQRITRRNCECSSTREEGSSHMSEERREHSHLDGHRGMESLSTEEEEEEEEEDVKISLEMMAAMKLTRPHTQIDYVHHLVPHLSDITNCSFYWGKMDRYEAESLLDEKPEGSFLLRDSAQDEYLFSVSFRRYGRSLHARIEEQDHRFSFDCHDPGVFMSRNIPQLLDHYKDPASCMFFEPMLCHPVNRKNPFSLQVLSRAAICDQLVNYSDVDSMELPKSLKVFLKEYHYRHKMRVRRYDL